MTIQADSNLLDNRYDTELISSHFEHYGSVGHGPRSRFRSVRSEMKSTVSPAELSAETGAAVSAALVSAEAVAMGV